MDAKELMRLCFYIMEHRVLRRTHHEERVSGATTMTTGRWFARVAPENSFQAHTTVFRRVTRQNEGVWITTRA